MATKTLKRDEAYIDRKIYGRKMLPDEPQNIREKVASFFLLVEGERFNFSAVYVSAFH